MEYRIPKSILFSAELGRKEKLIFCVLYTEAVDDQIEITNAQLAEIIGCRVDQIRKSIKSLHKKGLIRIEYRDRSQTLANAPFVKFHQKRTMLLCNTETRVEHKRKRKRRAK